MHVVLGPGFLKGDQVVNSRTAGQQAKQWFLASHDHCRTPLFDQRRVANELQCIPQPLLEGEQDRASHQGGAVPVRPGKAQRAGQILGLPAPFKFGEALRQVSLLQRGQCPAQVPIDMVRLELQNLVVAHLGLLRLSELCKGVAVVEMGLDEMRL